MTDPITDADIQAAIEQHDDPQHPDALTVAEVRELLHVVVQKDAEAAWSEWMDNIERDDSRVVADDGDTVVLSTGEYKVYDEILDRLADDLTDVEYDDIAADVVSAAIHNAAERLSDYDWGVDYPIVIAKPDGVRDGEDYTTAVINSLLRRGLSPGQAWAYYGVEIRGYSRNQWASRCGYNDHSAVSEALRKAKAKL